MHHLLGENELHKTLQKGLKTHACTCINCDQSQRMECRLLSWNTAQMNCISIGGCMLKAFI